jgi:hypothetical protein
MDGAEVGMKRLWIILAFLALAGCVPVESNPDLYVAAQSSRATSDAAAQEALFQERYLTATAEAPIIHITQTAAALVVQATQQSIDQTSTAVLWTPTPSSTPTIIPSATPNLTATLNTAQLWGQQTAIANNIQRDNLELDRQRSANDFCAGGRGADRWVDFGGTHTTVQTGAGGCARKPGPDDRHRGRNRYGY